MAVGLRRRVMGSLAGRLADWADSVGTNRPVRRLTRARGRGEGLEVTAGTGGHGKGLAAAAEALASLISRLAGATSLIGGTLLLLYLAV